MKIFTIIVVLVSLVVSAEAQVQCVADIALVIDESGSIQDTDPGNWGLQINFVKNLIQNLDVGLDSTRVAAVTFSNFARLHFNLSKFSTDQQMMNAIDGINYAGGNTNTTGGLLVTLEQVFTRSGGDRDGVEDIIILITDGNPTWDVDTLDDVVNRIKNQGILIIGVGVTDRVNITVFRDIVSPPFDEHYFPVNAFDQLSSILDDLITSSCRTIRPTPAPTPTQPAPEACSNIADIVFVMDASGSIGDTNFGIMKNFISDLVSDLDIGQNRVRVGLETFADNNQPFFQLNTFYSRTDMMAAVSEVPYSRGRTNTASAINYLTNTMFTSGNGDRSNAGNIAVIITDGGSNNKIETLREAFEAKSQGIHIIVISVGNWVDQEELIGMATYPYQNNLISVDNVNALAGIKDKLRNLVCNNVNECFSNPCRNGGQCVDGIEMYICICPSGWAGVNCDQRCRVGADLVFALDASGSIGRENFQKQVDFVKDIVYGINLNGDSRVGVLTYADNPDIRFHLDEFTTRMDVLNALALFYSGGTTNTASAISTMDSNMFQSNQGDRGNYDNIGVVMTDGRSNDELATWQAALTARRNDIQMLAIGVGNNVNVMELEGIASAPVSSNVFTVNNFDSLSSIANNLIQAVCDEQNECNSNPCRNGGTCVDLINGYECHCTSQWTGVNCEKGCSGKLDVIFIIDASGSIRNERFPYVIDYMVSIAESFEIRDDKTRVGAVKFSDNAEIQFHLNEYQARQDVLQALKRITFIGGRTNTASALQLMMDNMFTAGNGDREDAQNIVVILTDGNSNINEDMTIPYAIDAKLLGTHVIVAAVGSDLNELELRGMASMPISNTLYMVNSWTGLQSIRTPVIESTCNDQNDCQSNPCQNGGQCVDTFNRYFCICQPDWSGERCNRRCSRQMDVVFVLDISGSMDQVYDLVIAVTKEIVQGLPMSFSRARVGLVHYSDNAQVNFNLFKYQSREEVLNAIAFRKAGGRTNTQEAIRMANQNVFTSSSGDRSGVPNIMVVVTDGGSNVNEYQTAIEAQNARNNGIEIYAIALGNSPEMGEINEIASTPQSEHVIQLPNESQVSQAASTLLDSLCQQ